jgi:hypothetical protein
MARNNPALTAQIAALRLALIEAHQLLYVNQLGGSVDRHLWESRMMRIESLIGMRQMAANAEWAARHVARERSELTLKPKK